MGKTSLPDVKQLMDPNSFVIPNISETFVKIEIHSMSLAEATSLDNISVKLLKITDFIANILTHILGFSIEICIVEKD